MNNNFNKPNTFFRIGLIAAAVVLAVMVAGSAIVKADDGDTATKATSLFGVAAETLGMTEEELYNAMAEGKSIADVAKSKDVAVKTIVDAYTAGRAEQLKAAVENEYITQEQSDAMLNLVRVNATVYVSKVFELPKAGAMMFGRGMREGRMFIFRGGMFGEGMFGEGIFGHGFMFGDEMFGFGEHMFGPLGMFGRGGRR